MKTYIIKDYQKGVENDQALIGYLAATHWVWPYAYDLEDLIRIHARADFDPDTRHYCFLDDEMVGYSFSLIEPDSDGSSSKATFEFPRVLPGHESADELLIEKAMIVLREKGVSRVTGRVTTMCPDQIRLAEKSGFSLNSWGYKLYYSYEISSGSLDLSSRTVRDIDPENDLDECARIAARWYKRPQDWCRSLLADWHEEGVISHSGVWQDGELVASCMAAPNSIRPSTAAIYYIYAPDEESLKPMLADVVSKCAAKGITNLIVDLINEHLLFEPIYQALGFEKVAEWAKCEKILRDN